MIDWSLNPKKSIFDQKPAVTITGDNEQEGPLATSKLANKGPLDVATAKGDDEVAVKVKTATPSVTIADADPLCDEDDLDALEALAAAEDDFSAPKIETVHEEVIVEEAKKD